LAPFLKMENKMRRTRLGLIVGALGLVILLFNLPKIVVDNERDLGREENSIKEEPVHDIIIPKSLENQISLLRENFETAVDPEKSAIFADSLANLFAGINKWDSAAVYFEWNAVKHPSDFNRRKAGEAYYNALGTTVDEELALEFSRKAQTYFEKVLENEPDNLEVKNKLAMTFVTSSNPMEGILLLRKIVTEHPRNEEALLNLGMLSMQSGQWDKAVERFETLTEINEDNLKAHFYLAVSSLRLGDTEKAKSHFSIVKDRDKDPEVQANVDSYLEDIDN